MEHVESQPEASTVPVGDIPQLEKIDADILEIFTKQEQEAPEVKTFGPKVDNETKQTPFYPGDLVCYKSNKPFDWTVWYGKIISPENPLLDQLEDYDHNSKLTFLKNSKSMDWNYEEGLKAPFYVQWNHSNRIGIVKEADDICLVDREFYIGQRVMSANGVKGSVVGSSTRVGVKVLHTSHVIENLDVSSLNPISDFVRGREILYRGWIGIIIGVKRLITAQLDSGPTVDFVCDENDGFMKVDPYSGPASPCVGSRTKFTASSLNRATYKSRILQSLTRVIPPLNQYYASSFCTISSVETTSIDVVWLEKCPTASGNVAELEPEKTIKSELFKFVKLLGIPSQWTIGINSTRMYPVQPTGKIISYPAWFSGFQDKVFGHASPAYKDTFPLPPPPKAATGNGYIMPVKIIGKTTYAEVEWDGGIKETLKGSVIPFLAPIHELPEYPVGIVVEPGVDSNQNFGPKKYGVVQVADQGTLGDKTVKVQWIIPNMETEDNETIVLGVKKESVYDIKPHEKYCLYQKGTILGLRNHPQLYEAGTVVALDVLNGKIILTVPNLRSTISVWPHEVIPIQKRCYWNFFRKTWIKINMLPPLYHILTEESNEILHCEHVPVTLNDNNNIIPKPPLKSIWHEANFEMLPSVTEMHHYYAQELRNPSSELLALLCVDIANLKDNLPDGIWVRGYENRMDIFSVLILGPEDTPFEDGLYFFDIQVPIDFPARPPKIHHVQYASGPISPFIAYDGTFCSSKLQWEFTERPSSYLAEALAQVQRIVFTREPFFDIIGKETLIGTPVGDAESRAFNEEIFLGLLTASYNMAMRPYEPWREVIREHLSKILPEKINAVTGWIKLLDDETNGKTTDMDEAMPPAPGFNILPISEGFKMAVTVRIEKLQQLFPSPETLQEEESKKEKEFVQVGSASTIDRLIQGEVEQEQEFSGETVAVD